MRTRRGKRPGYGTGSRGAAGLLLTRHSRSEIAAKMAGLVRYSASTAARAVDRNRAKDVVRGMWIRLTDPASKGADASTGPGPDFSFQYPQRDVG